MKRIKRKNKKNLIYIDIKFGDAEFNKKGELKKLKAKNFKKVLNILVQKFLKNKPDKDGYVNIHSTKFSDEYSLYTDYLHYLLKNGFLKSNGYEVGIKATGYRFTEVFKKNIKIENIVIPVAYFKKKNKHSFDSTRTIISDAVYDRLRRDFKNCKINLDFHLYTVEKTKDE